MRHFPTDNDECSACNGTRTICLRCNLAIDDCECEENQEPCPCGECDSASSGKDENQEAQMTATTGSAEVLALAEDEAILRDYIFNGAVDAHRARRALDRILVLARITAKPAEDVRETRETLVKIAEWADLKDVRHPENASGEEVAYDDGYSAGLRAAGKFARAGLSTPGQPKP